MDSQSGFTSGTDHATEGRPSPEALGLLRDDVVRRGFALVGVAERMRTAEFTAIYRPELTAQATRTRDTMRPLTRWHGPGGQYFEIMERDANFTRVRRVLDYVMPGDRVLDIGSGRGYLCGAMLRDSPLASYVGIDIVERDVQAAKSMIEVNNLGHHDAQFEIKNVYDLTPEWVAKHDPTLVVMFEMLEHVPDAEAALSTVAGCLSPDAALVFTVPLRGRLEQVWGHLSRFDVGRLRRMCEQAGLQVQYVEIIYDAWAAVMVTRSDAVSPRLLHVLGQEPPPVDPGHPVLDFVRIKDRVRVSRVRQAARRVEVTAENTGTRVRVQSSRNPFRAASGGLSFDLDGDRAVRFEVEFEQPGSIREVRVKLSDDCGRPVARWLWKCGPGRRSLPTKHHTYVLTPGEPTGHFKPVGTVKTGTAIQADIVIKVAPTRSAGFTLLRVASLRARPAG
ncbi:MAG TPA: class I SAM-dependent methyltransferase [Actinomycetes bacterium]|nr:class I SAM-dependent methyltransferase [Actinomycetes bacterium]